MLWRYYKKQFEVDGKQMRPDPLRALTRCKKQSRGGRKLWVRGDSSLDGEGRFWFANCQK
jgi:hypothetical protein